MQRVYKENEWGKVSKRIVTVCGLYLVYPLNYGTESELQQASRKEQD